MKKSTELMATFLTLPFVASASIEFLPTWLAMPTFVIAVIFWMGNLVQIMDYKREDDK